jgi:hypothetical protein
MKNTISFSEIGSVIIPEESELFISSCKNHFGDSWTKDSQMDFNVVVELSANTVMLRRFLAARKAKLLGYTNKQFKCYRFNHNNYDDLDSVKKAKDNLRTEKYAEQLKLASSLFCEISDMGHTWHKIDDIETYVPPANVANYHFKIFNQKEVDYKIFDTLEDAKKYKLTISQQFTDEEMKHHQIHKVYVYAEDGVTMAVEIITE